MPIGVAGATGPLRRRPTKAQCRIFDCSWSTRAASQEIADNRARCHQAEMLERGDDRHGAFTFSSLGPEEGVPVA